MAGKELDDLSERELTLLAMKAFIFLKKKKQVTDEQLLGDILMWFEIMTFGSDLPKITEVDYEPQTKRTDAEKLN